MQRQLISSSNLRSVGYDPSSMVLEIEFHESGVYQYRGVPASVHANLIRAVSPGRYFHQYVKDRYPDVRVG